MIGGDSHDKSYKARLAALARGDGPTKGADGRVEPGKVGQLVLRSEAPLRRVATVDVRLPMQFKVRGGRKEMILPADAEAEPKAQPNRPLVLALARAYHWQRMIETGEVPGIEAIAAQHGVDRAYVSRILDLATLAPDLTQAAMKGKEPKGLSLAKLHRSLPLRWGEQQDLFDCGTGGRRKDGPRK